MECNQHKSGFLERIHTPEAPQAIGPYSQAVSNGSLVFVSGQLPIDPKTGELVPGDIRVQTQQVLANLESILRASGTNFTNVVRVDIFLTNLNDFAAVNEEYGKKFQHAVKPARQTIQVSRLPKDAPIEISCIASKF